MTDDMKKRAGACVHVYCVDKILVKIVDRIFGGFSRERGTGCCTEFGIHDCRDW